MPEVSDPLPPDLSVERIAELQAQCRDAFDLPALKLSELDALLSLAARAASGESEWIPLSDLTAEMACRYRYAPVSDGLGVGFARLGAHYNGELYVSLLERGSMIKGEMRYFLIPSPPKDENDV